MSSEGGGGGGEGGAGLREVESAVDDLMRYCVVANMTPIEYIILCLLKRDIKLCLLPCNTDYFRIGNTSFLENLI